MLLTIFYIIPAILVLLIGIYEGSKGFPWLLVFIIVWLGLIPILNILLVLSWLESSLDIQLLKSNSKRK